MPETWTLIKETSSWSAWHPFTAYRLTWESCAASWMVGLFYLYRRRRRPATVPFHSFSRSLFFYWPVFVWGIQSTWYFPAGFLAMCPPGPATMAEVAGWTALGLGSMLLGAFVGCAVVALGAVLQLLFVRFLPAARNGAVGIPMPIFATALGVLGLEAIFLLIALKSSASGDHWNIIRGTAAQPDACVVMKDSNYVAEVCEVDDARFAAMVKGDADALAPLLGDELRYVHSDGRSESKSEILARLRSGALRYEAITPLEREIRLSGGSATILGRANLRVQAEGHPLAFEVRFLETYVWREDRRVLVAWQSTRMPAP